ncbi:hypothetical protein [Limosilactobacillus fermentum]
MTASVAGSMESLMSVIAYQLATTDQQRSMLVAWIYTGFSIASAVGNPLAVPSSPTSGAGKTPSLWSPL